MFDQLFGNYLVDTKRITAEQFAEVLAVQSTVRVKLGLIAVAEKLMTMEQADEVNRLQAVMDKRFGDIAVGKGYLTEEQISAMLKKQGNIYMVFVQTLVDNNVLTLEEIEGALVDYLQDMELASADKAVLMSGNIDDIINLFLPKADEVYARVCGVAIRTIFRLIDSTARVGKAFWCGEYSTDRLAMQEMDGDMQSAIGFAGQGSCLLAIANPYAMEEFAEVDLDALDAVGELINNINGMFSSSLAKEGVETDMIPPAFYDHPVKISGKRLCVFPIFIKNDRLDFIVSIDDKLNVDKV
ncbi:MAG: chemotaxis protein CheX [Lachnospiraceae bacterium]|jgi:CheY-specific phosphatase CheX|nr:chemotaxis protein CheX [Lachnospiraceae bacterium]